jgi:DNA-binding MarR family transcriptional regulator
MSVSETPLLSMTIKRCGRAIDRDIDRTLKQHGIARSQYRVLYYVAHYDEPSQSDLIEKMEIQPSTLTLIVDVLVHKGWLVRTKDPLDKRLNKLRLTPAGKKIFQQIPDPAQKLQKLILKNLSRSEAQALGDSLTKITKALS